jgi:hypothetical protein
MANKATPYQRPTPAAASSIFAIRTRIRLVAHERRLAPQETKKALGLKHFDLMCFAEKYGLGYDWLLTGDLRGLLTMARRQCAQILPVGRGA